MNGFPLTAWRSPRAPMSAFYRVSCFSLASIATSAASTFIGPETVEAFEAYPWSNSSYWSEGVPGAGDHAFLPARVDENGQNFEAYGPFLDIDVTLESLEVEFGNQISNSTTGIGKNLFVSGFSTIQGQINNSRGTYSLGDLTNYDSTTSTLGGGVNFVVSDDDSNTQAIVQFKGANIVVNNGIFNLFGSNVIIRDQNTGLDAFRNLAENNGAFQIDYGYEMDISGNFKNGANGYIILGANASPRVPKFRTAGNFLNDGRVVLNANTVFTVAGGLSGSGSITVSSLPCVLNVAGTYQLDGGSLNLGGSGIDSFTLITSALVVNSGGTVTGNGTAQSSVTVTNGTIAPGNSTGNIAVQGDLTLQAEATLAMEIAGTTHDKVTQSGGANGVVLGGILALSTITDFDEEVLAGSTYEILTSNLPLAGSFSNVANGARVTTTNGAGSFLVSYGPGSASPNKVVLGAYIANIVPQTYAQWATGLPMETAGPYDDADVDGISNIEAYFRGIPATGPRFAKAVAVALENDLLTVTIRSPKSVAGVNLSSKTTGDFFFSNAGPIPVFIGETPTRDIYQVTVPAFMPKLFVTIGMELDE